MRGVKPKQSLGQNFLIDDNIARNIVRDIAPQKGDVLIEIGPGQGALTKHLAASECTLIAFEIDGRVVETLRRQFQPPQVTILHQDFLPANLLPLSEHFQKKLRIAGNIPYHLTSEILFKVIEERKAVSDATLMIQKEVAQRLIAKPGTKEYGILSVVCSFYGTIKKLFTVSPNCFYPKPGVTSAVIQFKLFDELPFKANESLFSTVVRTSFGKRRKVLRNSLQYLPFEETKVVRILARTERWSASRAEELTVEQFVELTNTIEQALQDE